MPRILVSIPTARHPNCARLVTPTLREGLARLGEVAWHDGEDDVSFRAALQAHRPEILVGAWNTPLLTPDHLAVVPSLKVYAYLCGGLKKAVERACIERGLIVSNWGDVPGRFVAEGSLTLLLAALRAVPWFDRHLHEGRRWRDRSADPLVRSVIGRRIGIHGLGAIGRALVPMLKAMHCRVAAHDPFVSAEAMQAMGVDCEPTAQGLYRSCSGIVNLLPAIPATRRLVGRDLLRLLPDGACYVLTGRAWTTDLAALADELATGRITAGIDVFDPEEPPPLDLPLRKLPNCVLQPHTAMSEEAQDAQVEHLLSRLQRYLDTGVMPDLVTPARYDAMT